MEPAPVRMTSLCGQTTEAGMTRPISWKEAEQAVHSRQSVSLLPLRRKFVTVGA